MFAHNQGDNDATLQEEIISIGRKRHGENWKAGLSVDAGWSWWTFNRLEKGEYSGP